MPSLARGCGILQPLPLCKRLGFPPLALGISLRSCPTFRSARTRIAIARRNLKTAPARTAYETSLERGNGRHSLATDAVNYGNKRERERALKGTSLDTPEELAALASIRNDHPCSLMPLIEKALAGKTVSAIARLEEIGAEIAAYDDDDEECQEGAVILYVRVSKSVSDTILAASHAAGENFNVWIVRACEERLAKAMQSKGT